MHQLDPSVKIIWAVSYSIRSVMFTALLLAFEFFFVRTGKLEWKLIYMNYSKGNPRFLRHIRPCGTTPFEKGGFQSLPFSKGDLEGFPNDLKEFLIHQLG